RGKRFGSGAPRRGGRNARGDDLRAGGSGSRLPVRQSRPGGETGQAVLAVLYVSVQDAVSEDEVPQAVLHFGGDGGAGDAEGSGGAESGSLSVWEIAFCSTGFQPVPCRAIRALRHGLETRATKLRQFGMT